MLIFYEALCPRNLKLYFVDWFKISWHISCANWGLSEVKFLKYPSLIILRLIDWFSNLVILLLIQVKFAPDIEGITRYTTGSVVTKTSIIIANAQKIFICITRVNCLICQMEQMIGTLFRGKYLKVYWWENRSRQERLSCCFPS